MLSRRLPLTDVIDLCRVLRHQLGAGISIQQVLKKQSERGRSAVRALATRVSDSLRQGERLSDALDREQSRLPPLFLSMTKLGETTGNLAEIYGELERYFQLELQLRRQFRSQTILPIVQFIFAVLILAGVIYVLGMIADMNNTKPLLTIFGLKGAAGALAFLGVVFGTIAGAWGIFKIASKLGSNTGWMDRFLLSVPALGPCLRSLAMSRLTLAMQLTLDSGLSIGKALRISLEATGNAYFISYADAITQTLKRGNPLHSALESSGLFTSDFLDMIVSSEVSGSVPEMMRHLAQQYQEETQRRLTLLTRIAAGAVWLGVAGFIIWAIFRLAAIYLDALGGKL